MRLLRYEDGGFLFSDHDDNPPVYAILSHTWSDQELTYREVLSGKTDAKLKWMQEQASKDGYKYFWIDTCCIDKRNDAEVTYAIRSMWRWYQRASVCYVYLTDVSADKRGRAEWQDTFRSCRWFTRGWTLQELLAHDNVHFFARDGHLGSKTSLKTILEDITGIDTFHHSNYDHRTRLAWARKRTTRRPEDLAYCMMGICGIVMDARYGEGDVEAFRRLEAAIVERYGTIALETRQDAPCSRKEMLKLLKFDVMESRRTTISLATAETCKWFLSHRMYTRWLAHEHNFLWIKGKAGTGKSVMVKFLDQHITNTFKDCITISFYFNARGEELERTFLGCFRSLIVQLVETKPALLPSLDQLQPRNLSISQLQDALAAAVRQLQGKHLWIFIDALDECQEDDVSQMIAFFQVLDAHVCFASRHYPIQEIETILELTLEETTEHTEDLISYIRNHLKLQSAVMQQIIDEMINKANGIFLWVVLVVDILRKEYKNGRVHAVQTRLKQVPVGLKELLEDIINRDRENMPDFVLCLRWILYTFRPLKLPEWYFGMMAGFSQTQVWNRDEIDLDCMKRYLLSSSKGFAELSHGKQPVVQFIHESVRDFLLKDDGFKTICGTADRFESQAHKQLRDCCLAGLYSPSISLPVMAEGQRQHEWIMLHMPFAEYSALFMLHHADKVTKARPHVIFLFMTRHLNAWKASVQLVCPKRAYKPEVPLLYICAELNLARVLRHCSGRAATDTVVPARFHTPLMAAFGNKSWDAARSLLRTAENPAAIVLEVSSRAYKKEEFTRANARQPWRWAVERGLTLLSLHLLCDTTALRVYEKQGKAASALESAIHGGSRDVVRKVLTMKPDLVKQRAFKTTNKSMLDFACGLGRWHVVDLLCTALSPGGNGDTYMALVFDRLSALNIDSGLGALKVLSDLGVNFEARDKCGRTPLLNACRDGNMRLITALLEYGADAKALCNHGYTALIHVIDGRKLPPSQVRRVIERQYGDIISILVSHGCELDARSPKRMTALMFAAQNMDIDLLELLLDRMPDLSIQDADGNTALLLYILALIRDHDTKWSCRKLGKDFMSKYASTADEAFATLRNPALARVLYHLCKWHASIVTDMALRLGADFDIAIRKVLINNLSALKNHYSPDDSWVRLDACDGADILIRHTPTESLDEILTELGTNISRVRNLAWNGSFLASWTTTIKSGCDISQSQVGRLMEALWMYDHGQVTDAQNRLSACAEAAARRFGSQHPYAQFLKQYLKRIGGG